MIRILERFWIDELDKLQKKEKTFAYMVSYMVIDDKIFMTE